MFLESRAWQHSTGEVEPIPSSINGDRLVKYPNHMPSFSFLSNEHPERWDKICHIAEFGLLILYSCFNHLLILLLSLSILLTHLSYLILFI